MVITPNTNFKFSKTIFEYLPNPHPSLAGISKEAKLCDIEAKSVYFYDADKKKIFARDDKGLPDYSEPITGVRVCK